MTIYCKWTEPGTSLQTSLPHEGLNATSRSLSTWADAAAVQRSQSCKPRAHRAQRQQGVYVVNTHTDREPGEHWVVLFFQRDSLYYFDSYGLPLHPNIAAHLQTRKRIFYNPTRLQGSRATCGNYCLYHVLSLVHPYHSLNTFGPNLAANDKLVLHLTGHFFNV